MASAIPSRIGQANLAGDAKALFLKKFAGEVLAAFSEHNVAKGKVMTRSITGAKSAQFPALGKTTATAHTPGAEILGKTIAGNERVIEIRDLYVSDVFIPNIDEAMSHFDYRSEYTRQCGAALARKWDIDAFCNIGLAARAAATVTGLSGGTAITSATARTNADALITAIFGAAQAMDEKDVPAEGRYVAVKPEQYYLLVNSGSKSVHTDYNPETNGSIASGKIYRIAGMEIVKTNNLPTTVVTGDYAGTFTNTAALAWHRSAVGVVSLMDLAVESEYQVSRQGTLIVAKQAVGMGYLRPESAVEIKVA